MGNNYNHLVGQTIRVKKTGETALVVSVTEFEEDTFGQGKFAVTTDTNKYLYENEIDMIIHPCIGHVHFDVCGDEERVKPCAGRRVVTDKPSSKSIMDIAKSIGSV